MCVRLSLDLVRQRGRGGEVRSRDSSGRAHPRAATKPPLPHGHRARSRSQNTWNNMTTRAHGTARSARCKSPARAATCAPSGRPTDTGGCRPPKREGNLSRATPLCHTYGAYKTVEEDFTERDAARDKSECRSPPATTPREKEHRPLESADNIDDGSRVRLIARVHSWRDGPRASLASRPLPPVAARCRRPFEGPPHPSEPSVCLPFYS
ncbi:unnamed protein product, partial [Iphiclides podalirius]